MGVREGEEGRDRRGNKEIGEKGGGDRWGEERKSRWVNPPSVLMIDKQLILYPHTPLTSRSGC